MMVLEHQIYIANLFEKIEYLYVGIDLDLCYLYIVMFVQGLYICK